MQRLYEKGLKMQMAMKTRTKNAKLIWEKGLNLQNISTRGTKSDKNSNLLNYLGPKMKTVLTLGTKSDNIETLSLTRF